jgi:hypothetical protein
VVCDGLESPGPHTVSRPMITEGAGKVVSRSRFYSSQVYFRSAIDYLGNTTYLLFPLSLEQDFLYLENNL